MILNFIGQTGRPCPVKFKERLCLIYLFIYGTFNVFVTGSDKDSSNGLMITRRWIENDVEGMTVAYFR